MYSKLQDILKDYLKLNKNNSKKLLKSLIKDINYRI